jgi:hypothetical protein
MQAGREDDGAWDGLVNGRMGIGVEIMRRLIALTGWQGHGSRYDGYRVCIAVGWYSVRALGGGPRGVERKEIDELFTTSPFRGQ